MWHIFVKVIDNYGDMSIAWRLASGLVDFGQKVTLFIEKKEDIEPILKLQPNINFNLKSFKEAETEAHKANKIISIFDAPIPFDYLDNIKQPTNLFIYEYLSAESWVEDFHMKSSLTENKFINKRYFYPGFNDKTGGLLRERDHFDLVNKGHFINTKKDSAFQSTFFYYSHTSFESLKVIKKLLPNFRALILDELIKFEDFKNENWVETFKIMAFNDYDRLLQSSTLNFVRGEDSLTRAIFSGRPFIWQPYKQNQDHHLVKLNAFLESFYAEIDRDIYYNLKKLHQDWSKGNINENIFLNYLNCFEEIENFHKKKSNFYLNTKSVFENLLNDYLYI